LLVVDPEVMKNKELRASLFSMFQPSPLQQKVLQPAGMVMIQDKPGWQISDSGKEENYLILTLRTGCITSKSKKIAIHFDNSFDSKYISHNVAGMVRGTENPDSVVLFTAHYDHLGMMGSVVHPGANDNASGVAMIMDLARYYAANPPSWTVGFVAFTGEEAGLLGSFHYVSEPLIPLEQTKLVVNLDIVGSGSEGITMVNGSVYPDDFARLEALNKTDSLLTQVKIRGESPNSDHHPFHAAGVKSFFIYTMGKECSEYHNIYDRPGDFPFTKYRELFTLLTRFVSTYML
jgi:Iap family predicted aminopeptidase